MSKVILHDTKAFRFEPKVYGALILLLACLIALAGYSYQSLTAINQQRELLTEQYSRALGLTDNLRYDKARENSLINALILSGNPKIRGMIQKVREEFLHLEEDLESVDHRNSTLARINEIATLKAQLISNTESAITSRFQGSSQDLVYRNIIKTGAPLSNSLNADLDDLFHDELDQFMRARDKTKLSTSALMRTFAFVAIFTGVLFALIVLLVVYMVRRKQFQDRAKEQLYQQLSVTSQARKEILESVSHDLKNPLTAIELNLQILQRQSRLFDIGAKIGGSDQIGNAVRALHERLSPVSTRSSKNGVRNFRARHATGKPIRHN